MYWDSIFLFAVFLIYGLCIGSFLNVVIYRLPKAMPLAKGRSMCPACGHTLGIADLVPVFSFLLLGRKCRYCVEPISWRYMGVELLTGCWFGLCSLFWGFSLYTVLLCLYGSVLICAWFIDIDETYIPDRFHIIILILAIVSCFTGPTISLTARLAGAVVVGGGMLLISLATGGGIGGGDIKLLAVSGLLLGLKLTLPAFFLAYMIAAIRWVPPYLAKKIPTGFEVPMAPSFAIALMIMSLAGDRLLALYMSLF